MQKGREAKKNDEEAPATTRPQLIERLLTKFLVGGENEVGIHTVMADAHMKQKRVNRSTLEALVNGTLDQKTVLSCRFRNFRHPEKQD